MQPGHGISRRRLLEMVGAAGGLALVGGATGAWAQSAKRIERLSPELDAIIDTSQTIRELATGFGGDIEDVVPLDRTPPREGMLQRTSTCEEKRGQLLHVGDELHSRAARVLEDAHGLPAAGRSDEVPGIVAAQERGEVGSEVPDLDFPARRAITPGEIEEERDPDIIDILQPRSIDYDRTVGVAAEYG